MGSSVHGILQARILEWVAIPFSRGSSNLGIEPGSFALQADSLPSEPSGKPEMEKMILKFLLKCIGPNMAKITVKIKVKLEAYLYLISTY